MFPVKLTLSTFILAACLLIFAFEWAFYELLCHPTVAPNPLETRFATPLPRHLATNCSQLNRRSSVGVKNGRNAKKEIKNEKKENKKREESGRGNFVVFALCESAALLYANKSAAPHHMSPGLGERLRGRGMRQAGCCSAQKHISHYLSCF